MLLSEYFLPLLKENPADAQIVSHRLMLRAGMIRQVNSGIYTWLPLGLKVLRNIERIIRKNMDEAGLIEVLMPCIQPADLWIESGRYDAYGKEMLRIQDRHENQLIFGPTNEEAITDIVRHNIHSYKDLPKNLYQIQWKFRDEIRPRFGVMRGREFLMKDAYSFDLDFESAKATYDKMYITYLRTFKDIGLTAIPVQADSGAIGGNLSHEFHVLADTGESELYFDKKFETLLREQEINPEVIKSLYAAADEKHDPQDAKLKDINVTSRRGIEVGHIFYFGTKYSAAMGAHVLNNQGKKVPLEMGSYGIGVSRLIAAIIEASHDEKGIIWPEAVAPFKVSIINLKPADKECSFIAGMLYNTLLAENIDTLYDDTNSSAGSKFATHDLIGSPWQVIIGPKKIAEGVVELKHRRTGESEDLNIEAAIKKIMGTLNV
ncbi:MAG: proS [Rickettsiaceae bacterium]|jgi:prolyl-tRNA synthetase|nr:proS [Rickettsiaceae bacterium]